jgi:hypothetical protein
MNKYLPLLGLAAAAYFLFLNKKPIVLRLKETTGAFETLIAKQGDKYFEFIVANGQRPTSIPSTAAAVDVEDFNAARIL